MEQVAPLPEVARWRFAGQKRAEEDQGASEGDDENFFDSAEEAAKNGLGASRGCVVVSFLLRCCA